MMELALLELFEVAGNYVLNQFITGDKIPLDARVVFKKNKMAGFLNGGTILTLIIMVSPALPIGVFTQRRIQKCQP